MNKFSISFSVILFAVAVPYLEINDTHVFNPDWTPHARIHEVWQLITNSLLGVLCLWFVWKKEKYAIARIVSMFIMGGFLLAFSIKDYYGGSMKYLDGSQKTLLGVNIGVIGFGTAFALLMVSWLYEYWTRKNSVDTH